MLFIVIGIGQETRVRLKSGLVGEVRAEELISEWYLSRARAIYYYFWPGPKSSFDYLVFKLLQKDKRQGHVAIFVVGRTLTNRYASHCKVLNLARYCSFVQFDADIRQRQFNVEH